MTFKFSVLLVTLVSFQLWTNGQQSYRLDTAKSTLRWNSGEVGHHSGYIKFGSGSLLFSKEAKPVGGTFVIDMKTIKSTENKDEAKNLETDATMTKPDFFDVPRFPEAIMTVTEIVKILNSANHRVKGNLTIKGVAHPIEFIAAIEPKDNLVNIQADIELHRGWWGIDYKAKAPSQDLFSVLPKKLETDQMFIQLNLVLRK